MHGGLFGTELRPIIPAMLRSAYAIAVFLAIGPNLWQTPPPNPPSSSGPSPPNGDEC
jgi:hypothetical protein